MFRLTMPPTPIETRNVLYDISRLLRSRHRPFATGVDRIDLAMARDLVSRFGARCHFVHAGPLGPRLISGSTGRRLLDQLEERWNGTGAAVTRDLKLTAESLLALPGAPSRSEIISSDTTYVVASHSGLGKKPGALRRLDPKSVMARLVYIHDIIPIEYPEYQRPATRAEFSAFLAEVTGAPLTIASNSADTDRRVRALATQAGWPVRAFTVLTPTLEEIHEPPRAPSAEVARYLADPRPYFVTVGTIEPRKNHLLLLNVWRNLAASGQAPRLCIIGKRGWENENIVDMLDRCEAIADHVREFSSLADHEVQMLMKGATALLFPSFAEGLGIPLLEAVELRLPVVLSDLPVFREFAPASATVIDPLDGPAWQREILARASERSGC